MPKRGRPAIFSCDLGPLLLPPCTLKMSSSRLLLQGLFSHDRSDTGSMLSLTGGCAAAAWRGRRDAGQGDERCPA